jgi:hypothetical protein
MKKLKSVVILGDGSKDTRDFAKILRTYIQNPVCFIAYEPMDVAYDGFDNQAGILIIRTQKNVYTIWDIIHRMNTYLVFMDYFILDDYPERNKHEKAWKKKKHAKQNRSVMIVDNQMRYVQELSANFDYADCLDDLDSFIPRLQRFLTAASSIMPKQTCTSKQLKAGDIDFSNGKPRILRDITSYKKKSASGTFYNTDNITSREDANVFAFSAGAKIIL